MKMIGTLNGFPWWADAAPVERFRTAMEKYEGDTDIASTSTTTVWASLELFKKALGEDTATVDRASVTTAYSAIKDETLDGLLPQPITFTEGAAAPVVNCFWQYDFSAGDENPKLLAPKGESGNGASGDLATACAPAA
jgi:branched-chain amino acid transport system substrate-binding protein